MSLGEYGSFTDVYGSGIYGYLVSHPTLLYDVCEMVKDECISALTDPPDLAFVTDGDPRTTYTDCRLLAVGMAPAGMFRSINTRARGNSLPGRPTMKTSIPQITLQITLISTVCWPTQNDDGSLPTANEIESAALQVLTDRREIWSGLYTATQTGSLFSGLLAGNDCASLGEQPAAYFGPSGLNAGSVFFLYVDLLPIPETS